MDEIQQARKAVASVQREVVHHSGKPVSWARWRILVRA